jgi:hypothetical protein
LTILDQTVEALMTGRLEDALRAGRKAVLAHVPFGRELSDGAVKLLGYDGENHLERTVADA